MGSQVKAICSCGFEKTISIGGGRLNYTYTQLFPCYCNTCKDLVEGNLKDETLLCPECQQKGIISYKSKELMGVQGFRTVTQSFDDFLTDGNYKCPKCELMTLEFKSTGIIFD